MGIADADHVDEERNREDRPASANEPKRESDQSAGQERKEILERGHGVVFLRLLAPRGP
jgi:hypothetical protein